jgi:hypothetical protein
MAEENREFQRSTPASELDYQSMIMNNDWGSANVSEDLKEALRKYYKETNTKGVETITTKSLWGLLSYYTKDIRLGNLSEWNGELTVCRYHLDLAGQLLYAGMIEPFLVSLSKAITIIETSQSKNGFVRKNGNTLRQEHHNTNIDSPKKSFFGGNNQEKTNMGYN